MQTFLPYPSFTDSAKCLDRQRLGKQRIETLQILKAMVDPTYGWQNHPAVQMWRGHEFWLFIYGRRICEEWIERGYQDSVLGKLFLMYETHNHFRKSSIPPWMGNVDFHKSHRSNLLRKNPEHYRQFWQDEPDDLPYVWPMEGYDSDDEQQYTAAITEYVDE